MSVQTGRMKGQGSIALENSVIVEKEFGTVQLPGRILLGEGIPLDSGPGPQARLRYLSIKNRIVLVRCSRRMSVVSRLIPGLRHRKPAAWSSAILGDPRRSRP